MKYYQPIGILLVSALSGCASITGDSMQSISVTAEDLKGERVAEASCSLKNEKGEWQVVAPNIANIHKASGDLMVECEKEGHPNGSLRAISRAGAGMYGNIIFGGGIGAIIDHSKGTAYNYPDNLPVVMGSSVVVDRSDSVEKRDELSKVDEQLDIGGESSTEKEGSKL